MLTNTTKAKLKAGETALGCFVRYGDATLVEALGYMGWDFLVFDAEHGTISPQDCENMVRAAELCGVTPIVRVTTNQPSIILRFMDTGAQGALVPWVSSPAEAEAAVQAIKYHPYGTRGLGGVRAAQFGQKMPLADYVKQANAETLVAVQIENAAAVEQAAAIAAVEGVDVIFIGPSDLSHSLGLPGQPQHPTVQAAIQQVIDAVSGTDKMLGIFVHDAATARHWQQKGVHFLIASLESMMSTAIKNFVKTVRE